MLTFSFYFLQITKHVPEHAFPSTASSAFHPVSSPPAAQLFTVSWYFFRLVLVNVHKCVIDSGFFGEALALFQFVCYLQWRI